jgi:hypothetical protein
MAGKMTAWEAYLAGKLALPPGYVLKRGDDTLLLQRADGSWTAVFEIGSTTSAEVVRVAGRDHLVRGGSPA